MIFPGEHWKELLQFLDVVFYKCKVVQGSWWYCLVLLCHDTYWYFCLLLYQLLKGQFNFFNYDCPFPLNFFSFCLHLLMHISYFYLSVKFIFLSLLNGPLYFCRYSFCFDIYFDSIASQGFSYYCLHSISFTVFTFNLFSFLYLKLLYIAFICIFF